MFNVSISEIIKNEREKEIKSLIRSTNEYDEYEEWGEVHTRLFKLSRETNHYKTAIAILSPVVRAGNPKGTVIGYSVGLDFPSCTHLFFITTHYNHRRNGIGSMMLQHWKEKAVNGKLILCTWTRDNERNHRFYQKNGFEIIGFVKGLYGDEDNQIFLEALR